MVVANGVWDQGEIIALMHQLIPQFHALNEDQMKLLNHLRQQLTNHLHPYVYVEPMDVSDVYERRRNGKTTLITAVTAWCLIHLQDASFRVSVPARRFHKRFKDTLMHLVLPHGQFTAESEQTWEWTQIENTERSSFLNIRQNIHLLDASFEFLV